VFLICWKSKGRPPFRRPLFFYFIFWACPSLHSGRVFATRSFCLLANKKELKQALSPSRSGLELRAVFSNSSFVSVKLPLFQKGRICARDAKGLALFCEAIAKQKKPKRSPEQPGPAGEAPKNQITVTILPNLVIINKPLFISI